jgi:DNA end-binding protein Ku
MRSIWKGIISFGLVSVPVQLFSATQERSVPLHQVHAKDGGRIRMHRFCEAEGLEVPYQEIARGYQAPDGRTVVLTDEDLAALPVPSKKTIDVLAFVDADEIDPIMFSTPYYVGSADRAGVKPYTLLRDALVDAGQVAVTKVTLRTRESLAVLRVHDDVLVLQTMLWPQEVRPAQEAAPEGGATVRPQELKMARSLMDTLSEGFDLGELQDDYQEALREVVEARLQGVEPPREAEEEPATAEVIDLMSALRDSVRTVRRARGGGAEEETAAGGEAEGGGEEPRKRPAGRKAPAKKAASGRSAKKAPAKKAPARKEAASERTAEQGAGRTSAAGKSTGKAAAKKTAGKKTAAKKTGTRGKAAS